jgi:hypothetical protein
MKIDDFPFTAIDWSAVEAVEYPGATGTSYWRVVEMGDIRIRMGEFRAGYSAPDWCPKGHVVLILEGELVTELADGTTFTQGPGMGIHVGDGQTPHRSSTRTGARIFVVD